MGFYADMTEPRVLDRECYSNVLNDIHSTKPCGIFVIFHGDDSPSLTTATKGAYWQVVSGSEFCHITDNGRCVTDGQGQYGNQESCRVMALRPLSLTTTQYSVEYNYDHLTVGGVRFDNGHGPQGMKLPAGSDLVWKTDGSAVGAGFTVCASPATIGGLVQCLCHSGEIDQTHFSWR